MMVDFIFVFTSVLTISLCSQFFGDLFHLVKTVSMGTAADSTNQSQYQLIIKMYDLLVALQLLKS